MTLIALLLAAPALGDESCVADSSAGTICKHEAVGSHNVIDDDDDTTRGRADDDVERPILWDYTIDELFEDYFNCGEIIYGYNDEVKHTENGDVVSEIQLQKLRQQWAVIREKYVKEVNLIPIQLEATNSSNHGSQSTMAVPIRVGDAGPDKGRGLFATGPISKGTLVVNLDNGSTGIFKQGHSWREFVVSLPRETACNFIEWSWVQTIPPASTNGSDDDNDIRTGLTIFVAFDESNLLNSADWDGIDANVRCGSAPMHEGEERGPCRFHYYAARDIATGDELLINYGEFEDLSQQGWTDIGL